MSNNRIIPLLGGPSPSNYYTKSEIDTMLQGYAQLVTTHLVNYYLKSETYTKAEVEQLVGQITSFEVVQSLPTQDIKTNVIYLVGPTGSGADRYEEYIYSNNTWVKIGETSVDLSNYVTVSQLNTALGFYTTTLQLDLLLQGKQDTLTPGANITISSNVISADIPTLATVATSGSYNDLTDKPTIPVVPTLATVATTGDYNDLTGTPALSTVATTGDYNDLTNKPNIPDIPTLATVATSGSYNDLTDKPTIPTVGTGVVTLTQGGTTIGTFGLNDSNNKTIDIPAGSDGKPYIDIIGLSQQELADLYAEIIDNPGAYLYNNAVYVLGQPVNFCTDGPYRGESGHLVEDWTLQENTLLFQLQTTANRDFDNITYTDYVLLFSDGTTQDVTGMVEGGTAVEGTNDGTNWTSLTIGTETYDIPQGGGSGNEWYGSQYQFDTLGTYDPDTDYYISDQISYSEIKGTPDLSEYATKTEVQTADADLETAIAGKENNIVFLGTGGLTTIGTPLEGVTYAIEGETLPLTFTLDNLSTVTYNFVID